MIDFTDQLILGDCLEVMQAIPDQSCDMVLCDLPYGKTACDWDIQIPIVLLWEQYNRLIRQGGAVVLFGMEPFTSLLIVSNLGAFNYCWIWDKGQAGVWLNAKRRPLEITEDIVVFGSDKYNPQMRTGKYRHKGSHREPRKHVIMSGKEHGYSSYNNQYYPVNLLTVGKREKGVKRIHPTQKPVELFEYLIKTYTDEGAFVLDNCAGSGTTAIAVINTGRHYCCIEKDQGYYDLMVKRVEEHKNKPRQLEIGI